MNITLFMNKGSRAEQADSISINGSVYQQNFFDLSIELQTPTIAILCDGMGGPQKSKISKFACHEIYSTLADHPPISSNDIILSIEQAHKKSLDLFEDCGTTLAIVTYYKESYLAIATIGDSSVYGISDEEVKLLTRRQSIHNFLQAGIGPKFKTKFSKDLIQINDTNISEFKGIIMCSDGIHNSQLRESFALKNSLNGDFLTRTAQKCLFKDNASFILFSF